MTYFDIIKLSKCFVESSCQVLCHVQFTSFRAEKITQSNFVITFSPVNHALFSSLFFSLLSQPFSSLPTGGGNLGNSRWQTVVCPLFFEPLYSQSLFRLSSHALRFCQLYHWALSFSLFGQTLPHFISTKDQFHISFTIFSGKSLFSASISSALTVFFFDVVLFSHTFFLSCSFSLAWDNAKSPVWPACV